jgi:hypothetical protein
VPATTATTPSDRASTKAPVILIGGLLVTVPAAPAGGIRKLSQKFRA